MTGAKRRLAVITLATALVVLVFIAAIVQKATGVSAPHINLAKFLLGAIALAISLPLLGATILFGRRNVRQAWRTGDPSARQAMVAYLATRVVGAAVLWAVFIVILLRR